MNEDTKKVFTNSKKEPTKTAVGKTPEVPQETKVVKHDQKVPQEIKATSVSCGEISYSDTYVSCISCISPIQNKDTDTKDTIQSINTIDTEDTRDTYNNIPIYKIFTNNKDIVLVTIYSNSNISIKEITEKTTILLSTVKNIIHRSDSNDGLVDNGLIELIDTNPNKYKITQQGKDYIEKAIENHNDKQKQEQEIKAHQETLMEEINNLKDYILDKYETEILKLQKNKKQKQITFCFKTLMKWNPILCDELLDNPVETIKKIELAIEGLIDKNIIVRIKNLPETQKLKIGHIRVEHLEQFYAVEGIIKQRSQVKPLVKLMKFQCPSCGNIIPVVQTGHIILEPKICNCGRKGKMLEVSKELINLQTIKLEELPEQLAGRTDCQSINVLLKNDLTDIELQNFYNPGSRIRINGVVYDKPSYKNREKDTIMNIILEANSIEPQEKQIITSCSKEEIKEIQEMSKDKHIIPKLCQSFLPDLVGIEEQKLAVLLSMVKGGNAIREEIHCLFVGEPGMGKSEILKRIPKLFTNSRYANGASSSSVGLTASVIKDEFSGSWSLQAGAVVMANEGIACIDELDKMKEEEKNDLNECAEQGTVTINKAGISGSLQAKTTLIMASNPKYHNFRDNEAILSQINLPIALITRCDLMFVLRNTGDEMLRKMQLVNSEEFESFQAPIKEDLLIKYIMFARELKPIFTKESRNEIEESMKKILLKKSFNNDVNFTMRQFHAMRRLSTAIAKLKLKTEIDIDDVKLAWNLTNICLKTIFPNENYEIENMFNIPILRREDLIKRLQEEKMLMIDSSFEHIVPKLKLEGIIYEPKAGFISLL